MRLLYSLLLLTGLGVFSCSTGEDQKTVLLTEVNISLDSVRFQKIYDQINAGNQDSLLGYLSHPDPSIRVLAIRGFSGMMDQQYISYIGKGVTDPIVEVRRIASYTLGQSYNAAAMPYLMKIFEMQDSLGIDPLTFRYALEAVGKCGDSTDLALLTGISTYQPGDTLLLEGQSLGILHLSAKGFKYPATTQLMVRYATDQKFPPSVRQIASEYLARIPELDLNPFQDTLFQAFGKEDDPNIRMFIGKTLGRTGGDAASRIRQMLRQETDSRVRIALLQGCVDLPLAQRHGIWAGYLRDVDELVGITAADLILQYGSPGFSETYTNWAFSNFRPSVYARLLGAGNKYISNARFREMVQDLILQRIRSETDLYIKGDFIRAAGQQLSTARQLIGQDGEDVPMVVRTAILEAIMEAVRQSEQIGNREKEFLYQRWQSGDVAALSLLSPFFAEHKALFPEIIADAKLWSRLYDEISLPEGIEARVAMDQARALLFDISKPTGNNTSSLPARQIDWTIYESLDPKQNAEIITSRGTMTLELWKEHAPGTVVNFVRLADSGYYENLPIHRVVPNFVVQGGCNRGDGYGSLDYTIRSEVGPGYFDQPGLIGMASAGLHTESQQWFVTFRPTPHLNGRYTIFGRITQNLDVLNEIRRGDLIKEVKIIDR